MKEVANTSLEFKNEEGKEISAFTDQFMNSLINAVYPKIIIVVGKSREGKSTLMNHVLCDKSSKLPESLRLSYPFKAQGGENATTKEFLYYGPIKISEFCRRNNIEFKEKDKDCDLFFIDTEGTGNLYQMSKNLYHGIFSLESITTCILFVSKGIIDTEGLLYISRHIQTSKLFNSTSDNNFPGLAIIGRDIGLDNYEDPFEEQEKKRINQDKEKLNELKKRLIEKTGINFSDLNLKYIAEPPFDMPKLFCNSIKDLCKFIIDNSSTQDKKKPEEIINKFNQHEKIINKYPNLLDTDIPMEDTCKNIFSIELQDSVNKIKEEKEKIIIEKINSLTLLELSNIRKDKEKKNLNQFLEELKLDIKFEKETNSRYNGMKNIFKDLYDVSLLNLKKDSKSIIENTFNEKMNSFVDQIKASIERAKNESEQEIKNSIISNIEKLTSQQCRELNIEQYINYNCVNGIQKFEIKTNDIKNFPKTKGFYSLELELIKNFIDKITREELHIKFTNQPPWPKNIEELKKEQKIDKLIPNKNYILFTIDKRPYEVIAKEDDKIAIPNVKVEQNYRREELPCWRNSNGKVYESYKTNIDHWFEPNGQILILQNNIVYQNNWSDGGHKSILGGKKPPRPQQKMTTLSINVGNPWNIKLFDKSGDVSVNLSNDNHDMFVSGINGCVQNIKLQLI